MNKEEIKKFLKKTWNFLWNDDSVLSWIVSLILAFIIVKFIIFPILSLIFASTMPLVVIESGSMEHKIAFNEKSGNYEVCGKTYENKKNLNFEEFWDNCGNWYEDRNISETEFKSWRFDNGMNTGDIILIANWNAPKIGDIIVFNGGTTHPIIHRIVEIKTIGGRQYYSTKGDHNEGQLPQEETIPQQAIVGKAIIRIPYLGWIKLGIVKLFN